MAKIFVDGDAKIMPSMREAYSATRTGESVVTQRTADKLVTTQADGKVITLTGQNLTYAEDGKGVVVWNDEGFDVLHDFEQLGFNDRPPVDIEAFAV